MRSHSWSHMECVKYRFESAACVELDHFPIRADLDRDRIANISLLLITVKSQPMDARMWHRMHAASSAIRGWGCRRR